MTTPFIPEVKLHHLKGLTYFWNPAENTVIVSRVSLHGFLQKANITVAEALKAAIQWLHTHTVALLTKYICERAESNILPNSKWCLCLPRHPQPPCLNSLRDPLSFDLFLHISTFILNISTFIFSQQKSSWLNLHFSVILKKIHCLRIHISCHIFARRHRK